MKKEAGSFAHSRTALLISSLLLAALAFSLWYWWGPLLDLSKQIWLLLQDKEAFRQRIDSYGVWAPAVFILFQVVQVLFSPIPGELVGAIGGYVFDWFPALVYSTLGLALGSWINFFVARLLGQPFVERLIPPKMMDRISGIMRRQGVIVSLILFLIPGFPKDYYCYFLGLTPISWRVFMVISSVGRIPGTLVLSVQGALIYNEHYWSSGILLVLVILLVIAVYIWRERIYGLLYRLDRDNCTPPGAVDAQGPCPAPNQLGAEPEEKNQK
ncbi:MAG: TVP38/TMEM64 family protein [Desulfarculaceae bacterium]|jgi:uncharacterized membrane protein YdjX (TVP38/TMEM64 family)